MTDNEKDRDKLSVRLNEAFERLEKQHEENQASPVPRSRNTGSQDIEPPTRPSAPGILGLVLSLVAIGIASYAAYMVYLKLPGRNQGEIRQISSRLEGAERLLDQQRSKVNDLQKRIEAESAGLADAGKQNDQAIAAFQKQVEASIARINATLGTSPRDWLFAEVEYLLRLANQRVVMEGDVKGALVLFREADHIIRDTEGITAFDLRKSIAANIAQLEAVSEVDVDGIFVRLAALASQVNQLRQKRRVFKAQQPVAEPAAPPPTGFGQRFLAALEAAGARLATLVDFRRNGERIRPILPPAEEYYLRQNLILKIQMAQLALLRADQSVYVNSLNEAQSWIVEYFDPDDPVTTAMLKSLATLDAIDVSKKLPDVSQSLKDVRKLMAGFHQQPGRERQKE
jgi:uroporphyrin-3 C-methyltransferase